MSWIKTQDRLPERGEIVKVKAKPFPNSEEYAFLTETDWGTVEWLIAGMIHVAIEEVTEWAYMKGDKE